MSEAERAEIDRLAHDLKVTPHALRQFLLRYSLALVRKGKLDLSKHLSPRRSLKPPK